MHSSMGRRDRDEQFDRTETTGHDYERAIGALEGTGIAEEMREVRAAHREEWDDGDSWNRQ